MTLKTYREMIRYGRPAFSWADKEFVNRYLLGLDGAYRDTFGNVFVQVGPSPTVLWSSHTDTVHDRPGFFRSVQDNTELRVADTSRANCLGADCTTGVYLMREMIKAKVPGLYVFHRAEEIGARGAAFIADKTPKMLEGIQCAIAFDRKGFHEVITHQCGTRGASDAFAKSLASAIGMNMHPSSNGVFTDTAKYQRIIPECTNVSVGYFNQHSRREHQDISFLMDLREQLCSIDTSRLHIERDPTKVEPRPYYGNYSRHYTYPSKPKTIAEYLLTNRKMVAEFLEHYGFTVEELEREIALMEDAKEKERLDDLQDQIDEVFPPIKL